MLVNRFFSVKCYTFLYSYICYIRVQKKWDLDFSLPLFISQSVSRNNHYRHTFGSETFIRNSTKTHFFQLASQEYTCRDTLLGYLSPSHVDYPQMHWQIFQIWHLYMHTCYTVIPWLYFCVFVVQTFCTWWMKGIYFEGFIFGFLIHHTKFLKLKHHGNFYL